MFLLLGAIARSEVEFHEAEMYLWPDGVEIELAAPAAEVHLLLAFRFGLYAITEAGDLAPAAAAVLVEYNDAGRSTCYWNSYRPLPFDGDANPEWAGSDDEPGIFFTEDATTEVAARTLVCRFPRAERWRIRVTPLFGNTEWERRVPTLAGIAELRGAEPRAFAEAEPLPELVELPGEEVADRAEAVQTSTGIVSVVPPVQCPFCWTRFKGGCVERDGAHDYHCSYCSGAIHYRDGSGGFCSVLRDGRRHVYRLTRGPAIRGKHARRPPRTATEAAEPEIRRVAPPEAPDPIDDELPPLPPPEVVPGAPRPDEPMPAFGAGIVPGAPRPVRRSPAFGAGIVPGAPRPDRKMPAFGAGVVPMPTPRPAALPGHPRPR